MTVFTCRRCNTEQEVGEITESVSCRGTAIAGEYVLTVCQHCFAKTLVYHERPKPDLRRVK